MENIVIHLLNLLITILRNLYVIALMSPEFTYRKQCLRNLIRNSPSSSPSSLYYWCWRETYNATRRCLLSHGTLVRLSLMLTPCNINRSENGGERIRPYTTVAAAQCNSDCTESVCTSESKQQQLCIDTHIVHSSTGFMSALGHRICAGIASRARIHTKSSGHTERMRDCCAGVGLQIARVRMSLTAYLPDHHVLEKCYEIYIIKKHSYESNCSG